MTSPQRILLVEDHELMRAALRELLGNRMGFEICGETDEADEGFRLAMDTKPDLAIVDLVLKRGDGLELVKRLKAENPEIRTLVLTGREAEFYGERSLRAGASGYVEKAQPADELLDAIRTVLDGSLYLGKTNTPLARPPRTTANGGSSENEIVAGFSDRELAVFRRIGEGMRTRQIAEELQISPSTVETYRDRLKTKLHLRSGAELTRVALRWMIEHGC